MVFELITLSSFVNLTLNEEDNVFNEDVVAYEPVNASKALISLATLALNVLFDAVYWFID